VVEAVRQFGMLGRQPVTRTASRVRKTLRRAVRRVPGVVRTGLECKNTPFWRVLRSGIRASITPRRPMTMETTMKPDRGLGEAGARAATDAAWAMTGTSLAWGAGAGVTAGGVSHLYAMGISQGTGTRSWQFIGSLGRSQDWLLMHLHRRLTAFRLAAASVLARLGAYWAGTDFPLGTLDLHVRVGDMAGVADDGDGLAGAALGQDRAGSRPPPRRRPHHRPVGRRLSVASGESRPESDLVLLRGVLDQGERRQAWAEGAALGLEEAVALAACSGGCKPSAAGRAAPTPAEAQVADLAADGFTNVHFTTDRAGAPAQGALEARRPLQRGAQSERHQPLTQARRTKCPTRPTEMSDSQAKIRHYGACYGAQRRASWLGDALVHPSGVGAYMHSHISCQTAPAFEGLPNKDHDL